MDILQKALAFLATLGLLIVFHEWGHYLVARLCNVRVVRFSVGFGKVLWSRRAGRDRTEWALSAIPLGGYVKMLDEREAAVAPGELHRAFNRQGVWRRIAIVAAGPIANLVLAVALFAIVNVAGVEGYRAVLSTPPPASAAARAGLAAGDEIVAVDGQAVRSWQDLRWRLLRHSGEDAVRVDLRTPDQRLDQRTLPLADLQPADWEADFVGRLGLVLNTPPIPPVIGRVVAGSPAEQAGLKPGDRIESLDGVAIERWDAFASAIADRPDRTLELVVVRNGARDVVRVATEVAQRDGKSIGRIGVSPRIDPAAYASLRTLTRYGPVEAVTHAASRTWELSIFTVKMLGRIVIGDASLRNISGPLTMADYAGQSAQAGWTTFLGYLALISISLGVLNLLPVPLLDGGHLMYYVAEIFKGRPVSERALEIGQQIGMAVLFALMGLALYNDFARLL